MFFTLRRLFWFTTFIAIYVAAIAQLGIEAAIFSFVFGFGVMTFVSRVLSDEKYGDDEQFGWDVLFICFAIPALIFLFGSILFYTFW